ncbi:uncharacterized protein LOC142153643 [Mixophyes fleayi]|uniref:uncharacterized protein LOC142153643 n=1 Tax=Mixophyes fleayi TaxID=3061075 RepID=UPI003F4D8084
MAERRAFFEQNRAYLAEGSYPARGYRGAREDLGVNEEEEFRRGGQRGPWVGRFQRHHLPALSYSEYAGESQAQSSGTYGLDCFGDGSTADHPRGRVFDYHHGADRVQQGPGYSDVSGHQGVTRSVYTPLVGGGWDHVSRSGETEFREAPRSRPVASSTFIPDRRAPPGSGVDGNINLNLSATHTVLSSASQGHDPAPQEQRALHDETGAAVGMSSHGVADGVSRTAAAETRERPGVEQASGVGTEVGASLEEDAVVNARDIWIIGHSYIFWAAKQTEVQMSFSRIGNSRVYWLGRRGLVWDSFLPWLKQLIEQWGVPDILVIHLGCNDLGKGKSLELIIKIREDLHYINKTWPSIVLGWSVMIPRLS